MVDGPRGIDGSRHRRSGRCSGSSARWSPGDAVDEQDKVDAVAGFRIESHLSDHAQTVLFVEDARGRLDLDVRPEERQPERDPFSVRPRRSASTVPRLSSCPATRAQQAHPRVVLGAGELDELVPRVPLGGRGRRRPGRRDRARAAQAPRFR